MTSRQGRLTYSSLDSHGGFTNSESAAHSVAESNGSSRTRFIPGLDGPNLSGTSVSGLHHRFSWRSRSQPPFSDAETAYRELASPIFLNTESNQQMAGAGTDASSSNPSPTVRTSSYTTVSSGSVSHARLRNSSSVVAHRMSSAASRSRHSGQRRIPRTLRSTQHGDTGGPLLLSSSSSSNSLAGRYRTISGATIQHHTDDVAHTDTVSSPLLRFASLRLDTAVDGEGPRLGQSVPLAMVEGSSDLDEFPALSTRPMSDQNPVCPVPLTIAMHAQFRMNRTQSDNATTEWPVSRSLSGNPSNSFVDVSSSCTTENVGNNTNCSVEPIGVNSGNEEIPPIDDSSNRLQNERISHPSSGELGSGDSASSPQPNTSESTFFSVRFPPHRDLNQSSNLTTAPSSNTNQEPEADHDFYRSDPNRPPYRTADHPQKILVGLNDLRQRGQFCDVVLQAGSSRLPAHRNVLASSSQYFYAMFTGPMAEARSPCVQIQGIDENALVQLIDFIYTGEISVTEENVQTLLPAANLLQLPSVRDSCCEFLQSQLHPSNCLGIQRFADLHDCPDLLASSRRFTEQHFGELLEQDDEFLTLTAEQLGQLIASDRLAVTEDQVFEAVLRWIAHDVSNRQQAARNLCGRVRFSLLPRDYLVRLSQSEAFLTANPWCKDYLIEALSYHLLSWDEKLRVTSERAKPRTPVGLPKVLMVIGGQAPKAIRSVEYFDFRSGLWRSSNNQYLNADTNGNSGSSTSSAPTSAVNASSSPVVQRTTSPTCLPVVVSPSQSSLVDLPSRRCRCGVAVVTGLVYVVGGFNGALRVRSVEIYDPVSNTWHSGPNMECRRATLGVASLNGLIYAVGGFDGSAGLNTAEVLDLWAGTWRLIASMSCRRSSVGAGALDGKIYAVGGYDGVARRCLSSVECYDPVTNSWSPVADLTCRRSGPAVCELNNRLYAVGGHDGPAVRNTAEVYSPETGTWQRIADLNVPRRNAGLVAHDGCLYVVGGEDGDANLASVEKYDPSTNTWVLLPSQMHNGRSYAGVAVIERTL